MASRDTPVKGRNPVDLKIFISHSHQDEQIAKLLIVLIRSALDLPANQIRCTSVDGYRLPWGIPIDEQLLQEIHDSVAFIALLTPNSLSSVYVLFELGARWGARKPLFPVLINNDVIGLLQGPLKAISGLVCDSEAQLYQLIDELAGVLGSTKDSAAVYHRCIVELAEAARLSRSHPTPPTTPMREVHPHIRHRPWTKLRGEVEFSGRWNSSWITLATPRAFRAGDRLRLTLATGKKDATTVLVRLLESEQDPNQPLGILTPKGILVPDNRVIEVEVPTNLSEVIQISVHGGTNAWTYFLGETNGPARLTTAEVAAVDHG